LTNSSGFFAFAAGMHGDLVYGVTYARQVRLAAVVGDLKIELLVRLLMMLVGCTRAETSTC
jgi:hypothetical protein